jgi:hypothetical protein
VFISIQALLAAGSGILDRGLGVSDRTIAFSRRELIASSDRGRANDVCIAVWRFRC